MSASSHLSLAQAPAPPCSDLFRAGMRRLAGACTLLTSMVPGQGRAGWTGLTATAIASVTADPPQLLVCVNRSTWAHGIISQSGLLGVNVLDGQDASLAGRFAGTVPPEEKFDVGDWRPAVSGVPLLASALVSFDCVVNECITASTHDIFICDVLDVVIRTTAGHPLIYFDGAFMARQTNL